MTSEEKKDVRAYCAFLLKEHGFHFSPDDPVVPALYIIYLHMKSNGESNLALATQIQQALVKD